MQLEQHTRAHNPFLKLFYSFQFEKRAFLQCSNHHHHLKLTALSANTLSSQETLPLPHLPWNIQQKWEAQASQEAGFALQVKSSWHGRKQMLGWFQGCKLFTKKLVAPTESSEKDGNEENNIICHKATEISNNSMVSEMWKSNSAPEYTHMVIPPNSVIIHLLSHRTSES